MSEIPKAYESQSVEDKWYDFWQKHGCFTADPARVSDKRPAYAIVIPPPNVTGMLHMGHVLNNTIQDILARKARMDGKEVLWLPGTDHAGIATEGMVAKQLRKEEKKTKQDLGREEFIKRVWSWKEKHGGIIISQLKKLGCSCDWTRERFTMDPDYVRCVQKVFVKLYKRNRIYQGYRMVNWCPATQTALSDEEVEMKPQKGFLYYFRVAVVENDGSLVADDDGQPVFLTIATTRPETIPGDTGVAVNPKDTRYAKFIGKRVIRPLPVELSLQEKLIRIIGDEHVDFEFGTGVLKVTPAHDKADFQIGMRHGLLPVNIMDPDGTMNQKAGVHLVGLERFAARKVSAETLYEMGVLVEAKPYENNVGFSQRADVPIESRLSEQWFLKYPAVEQSKACVEQFEQMGSATVPVADSGVAPESSLRAGIPFGETPTGAGGTPALPDKMRFHPLRWAKVYDHWLMNIQDWCISRQLWWGHRIPVWRQKVLHDQIESRFPAFIEASRASAVDPRGMTIDLDADTPRHLVELNCSGIPGEVSYWSAINEFEDATEIEVVTYSEHEAKWLNEHGFTQDPDVLDTWFSSWLWPFVTMGWTGDKSQDSQNPTLKAFYPTTDLVTGPDIIFFWVARMIMAGYEFMGDLPFRNVYFTGIIRDKQGRKMSKSLGNSPDPLELIAKYGADALRFGTMRSAPLGQDVLFDEKDVELGRNFCNKLWNACRFRQMIGTKDEGRTMKDERQESAGGSSFIADTSSFPIQGEINPALLTSDDKWILLRLDQAIREVSDALATYNFSTAVQTLYRFFWSEYCDWYVEASKATFMSSSRRESAPASSSGTESESGLTSPATNALAANKLAVIDFVLGHTLRLFHPFLPFITEELWHGMGFNQDLPDNQGGRTIMYAAWPRPLSDEEKSFFGLDDAADKVAAAKYELVSLGRNLRRELKLDPARKLKFILKPAGTLPAAEAEVLKLLLNAETVEIVAPSWTPDKGTPSASNSLGELFLPTTGLIDFAAERARRTKELETIRGEIAKVQQKLANPAFTEKVPAKVLEEHRQRLADWQAKEQQVLAALKALQG